MRLSYVKTLALSLALIIGLATAWAAATPVEFVGTNLVGSSRICHYCVGVGSQDCPAESNCSGVINLCNFFSTTDTGKDCPNSGSVCSGSGPTCSQFKDQRCI